MKELYQENKLFIKIYIGILGLILILELFQFHKITFFLLSLFLNLFLINILKETKRVLKIEITKTDYIIMGSIILLIYLFYSLSLLTRNFIYYWDYSCYYGIQMDTIARFEEGILSGIRSFVGSTWSGGYGNFLSFIPQILFTFTNKTPNSYVSSCMTIFFPYIIFSLSLLIKKMSELWKIKNKEVVLGVSLVSFILMPLLHATAIFGQPDFFGLFFIFLIILLTINYDFEKVEIKRLVLLFFVTYFLFITRRWYVYWIVSYFICYIVIVVGKNAKEKDKLKMVLKNMILFGGVCAFLFGITLFPLLKNILLNDFKTHYVYYFGLGIKGEILSQIERLGIITIILLVIGIILGLIQKEYRKATIVSILQVIIIVFLFTRIQNMGHHHSMTLLPSYFFLLFVIICFFEQSHKKTIIYSLLLFLLGINFLNGVFNQKNLLFTSIPLRVPYQEDYQELGEVVTWLKENTSDEKKAYMITHTDKYNPDKLRNYLMPDQSIGAYLPYGSAVVGVHPFPIELLNAHYVITTTPYESISMEYKYEEVFEKLVEENKFELIKNFDMKNGYQILIYERKKEVDVEEIDSYQEAIKEESKQFPELYQEVLENYKKSLTM